MTRLLPRAARWLSAGALLALAVPALAANNEASTSNAAGKISAAAKLTKTRPIGVAVAPDGRTFLSFSRGIDEQAPFTLAELRDGQPVPFPEGSTQEIGAQPGDYTFVSVQGITIDGKNRLWVLDSAKLGDKPITPGAAKLTVIDLKTNQVIKSMPIPANVAGANAYLNDMRVDVQKGIAYITDSSEQGPNGLVVVDIATGIAMRRLNDHPSTKAEKGFTAKVEGKPLMVNDGKSQPHPPTTGVDGLALSPDGKTLYYCPNAGHHLYSVSADALADFNQKDEQIAATVKDLGDKGFASDGLLADAQGQLYLTDYENGAIVRRNADGSYETIAKDKRMLWPDSMALGSDGKLFFTASQLERLPRFNAGKDLGKKPFMLFSVQTDSKPNIIGLQPPAQARTPRK